MYEVGYWFVYLMNGAILAILAALALVAIYVKRGQYQRTAEKSIQVEMIQPSGHSRFYTVECAQDAKSIDIEGGTYYFDFPPVKLPDKKGKGETLSTEALGKDPSDNGDKKEKPGNERRWGKHPLIPFMGLSTLLVPIRKETFYLNNPIPMRLGPVPSAEYMAAEIAAMKRGAIAAAGTIKLAESEARQRQLSDAIANQPNKTYVYAALVGIIILGVIQVVRTLL